MTLVLGITGGLGHNGQDSAVALVKNSKIIFAIEEERLIRIKHARGIMPLAAIKEALAFSKKKITAIDFVAIYANYFKYEKEIKKFFIFNFNYCPKIIFFDHHLCHAASAYYPSGFKEANIITADFSGNGVSTAIFRGQNSKIASIKKFKKPNSLGIFYSSITQLLGFDFDNDEYKVMGLAPYGKSNINFDKLIKFSNFNYLLNKKYFDLTNVNRQLPLYNSNLLKLFNLKKRLDPKKINNLHLNISSTLQKTLEEIILNLVKETHKKTNCNNFCFAGGIFLNSQALLKISKLSFVKNIYVQPASSDAGAALGAAILASKIKPKSQSLYLGNFYTDQQKKKILKTTKVKYVKINKNNLNKLIQKISQNKIVAVFRGRQEFGPRALGNRSIIASPASKNMKKILNKAIKYREGFRPFAPIVRDVDSKRYFDIELPLRAYNSMNINVKAKIDTKKKFPSAIHVDYTSRVQILKKEDNMFIYKLITRLSNKYKIDLLLNTSFNLDKMPIVNTPGEALSAFFASGMDYLVLEKFIVYKDKF